MPIFFICENDKLIFEFKIIRIVKNCC